MFEIIRTIKPSSLCLVQCILYAYLHHFFNFIVIIKHPFSSKHNSCYASPGSTMPSVIRTAESKVQTRTSAKLFLSSTRTRPIKAADLSKPIKAPRTGIPVALIQIVRVRLITLLLVSHIYQLKPIAAARSTQTAAPQSGMIIRMLRLRLLLCFFPATRITSMASI